MTAGDFNSVSRADNTESAVFPGVTICFEDAASAARGHTDCRNNGGILEIRHCREGRIEFKDSHGYKYLAAGDMYAGAPLDSGVCFPTKNYGGIVIRADTAAVPEWITDFLGNENVNPKNLLEKFSSGFFSRSDKAVAHIFSELYSVPDGIRTGYFRVKALELFLFLGRSDAGRNESEAHTVTPRQIKLTCDINAYISAHIDSPVTLDALAAEFNTSQTCIKNAYKSVFSVPFSSYLRSLRMKKAALLIRKTDMSILDIAQSVGYSNPSKFAKAFRDEHGMTPVRYRKT